ncbi:DUF663-domain-containing protein [Aulographum hederae CBS 113979]|uniref:DUF663-domain-containing protein n=1 Tax=Aulographum hederae CBS 113979 TaxID=1176131 RepID=A0A6G1HE22_9PEZI|nr:DUF663-domain-containing protein [Aulographum hederae CBS 113979]
MAPLDSHHHRSTTKVPKKAFKSRHATKSSLKDRAKGKVGPLSEKGFRRTPHQQVMSKIERRNQARLKRSNKDAEHKNATSIFVGRDAAPRLVTIVPLCENVSTVAAVKSLGQGVDQEWDVPGELGSTRLEVERFKQKIMAIRPGRGLLEVLDACRMADYVVLVLSADEEVDESGEMLLKALEGQGVSNVITVVQGLDKIEPQKRRQQITASLKSFISHFFPTTERVYSLDSRQETLNLLRSLCMSIPKGVYWREDRSWMMVEDVRWPEGKQIMGDTGDSSEVILTGVIRGKRLKADRLVQVGDWGDFQISKITAAPLESRKKPRDNDMKVDEQEEEEILAQPTEEQDDLNDLAPEEATMQDAADYPVSVAPSERKGVLLDDHHYFSDEETRVELPKPTKLPKGTSDYQAAWYLDDVSDSDSDVEDVEDDDGDLAMGGVAEPADGVEGLDKNGPEPTEFGASEYPQSEMFLDPAPDDEAEQIEEYRAQRRTEAEEDREFPDEIELSSNVLARERLLRYRGLKSLRTSHWETEEDRPYQPDEWDRLLEVADYKAAKSRVMKETLIGGVKPGTRVNIHLKGVPTSYEESYDASRPLALYSLLRHEHKRAALNFSITLSSDHETPLRSKDELIMQCGPRRFVINPLFSQGGKTPNNVHKFDRYLHPGRNAIASFTGPITWGAVPTLYFKRTAPSPDSTDSTTHPLNLIATGTCLPPSHSRVIAKRIVLTGHPFKIHKKIVTVRYMFFNKEDVLWFKALQLWTKRGRSGFIKESLGMHGYFKAQFDGKLNPMDAIGVSLYKRVWPRSAKLWDGKMEALERVDGEQQQGGDGDVGMEV